MLCGWVPVTAKSRLAVVVAPLVVAVCLAKAGQAGRRR